MKRNLKAAVSLILVLCLMVGFAPESFVSVLGERFEAMAESFEIPIPDGSEAITDKLESGGWLYRICADGNVEITGYSDSSVTSLTIPASLEGAWVVRLAENAFAENTALHNITIPAQVNEIPETAFPNNTQMTIHAYNGTAALAFAQKRGFGQDNKSEYDFFDDVLDLSELKKSQWSLDGNVLQISAPYARLIENGRKVYLPARGEYSNGLPVEITSWSASGDCVEAYYSEISFVYAVQSFRAENVSMTPDVGNIQVLAEGVELDVPAVSTYSSASGSVSLPLSFNINLKLDGATSVSGSVGYTPNLSVTVDYNFLKINEFAFENRTTSSYNIKVKSSGTYVNKSAPTKSLKFARVPMISATVVSVWLDLSLDVSVDGTITFKSEISSTEKFTLKNGKITKSKSLSNKGITITAADLTAELKGAITVRVGFVAVKTYIEVAEVALSYGWKITAEWNSFDSPFCADLSVSRYLKLTARVGLLKTEVVGKSIKHSLAFGGEVFNISDKVSEKHYEGQTGKFTDSCTFSLYATVKYYIGKNAETKEETLPKGEKLTKPSDPKRENYTFGGWYKDILFTQAWDFAKDVIEKDMTLYAKWTNNATGQVEIPEPDDDDDDDGSSSSPPRLLTAEESLPYLQYEVGDDSVTITGYNGTPYAITVANEIEGKPVTIISPFSFEDCATLQQIVLPDSIVDIGRYAFNNCSNLENVNYPRNWTTVTDYYGQYGASPFTNCPSLHEIIIPEGVTTIPRHAFESRNADTTSSITYIYLPNSLTTIEESAFSGIGIQELSLPEDVQEIGPYAFEGCDQLSKVYFPDSVEVIGRYAFNKCSNLSSINYPRNWTTVTDYYGQYGASPFTNCPSLHEIIIPEGITTIPRHAFASRNADTTSSITSIVLPNSLSIIEDSAFRGTGILSVSLSKNINTIGAYSFADCISLERITIVGNPSSISTSAFENVSATVHVPIESIAADYFINNYPEFEVFNIPSKYHLVTWEIEGSGIIPQDLVCAGSALTAPQTPIRENYTFAGWYIDEMCSVAWDFAHDLMPDNPLTLYAGWNYTPANFAYAISDGKATITGYSGDSVDLVLPEELGGTVVTAIGPESIPEIVSRLTIPASITSIDTKAFRSAEGLVSITVDAENTSFYSESGVLFAEDTLLVYPQSKSNSTYAIPEDVSTIGERAFYNCDALRTLIIPTGVKTLGQYSIYDCDNLSDVQFSEDVSVIKNGNLLLCSDDLNVTGPIGAEKLTAYADEVYIDYNVYNLFFIQDDVLMGIMNLRAGDVIGELPQLESDKMVFLGWSMEEGGNTLWTETVMPNKNVILYAVMGHLFEYTKLETGMKLTKYTGSETKIRVPESINDTEVVEIAVDCFKDKTATLIGNKGSIVETYANVQGMNFEALAYTLMFESNGGRKVEPRLLAATEPIELPAPIRTGYELEGWYTDTTWMQKWEDGDAMPSHDLTLYARWKRTDENAVSMPFTFDEVDGNLVITGFTGTYGKVEIPNNINGQTVVRIADYAFENNEYIQVVTVPETVTAIGECAFEGSALYSITMQGVTEVGAHAFEDCENLTNVDLPNALHSIGEYAFQNCSALMTFDLPDGIETLEEGTFSGCSWLTEINLPANMETISEGTFRDCSNLKEISLGAQVSEIAVDAFEGCSELTAFSVEAGNMYFKADNGVLLNRNGNQLMLYPGGKTDTEYTIPDGVTTIAEGAMQSAQLRRLNLTGEITSIGANALRGASYLENIVFSEGLRTIGANAFDGCVNLTEVMLSESVESVGAEAFDMTSLISIYVPQQTWLDEDAIPEHEGLTIYGYHGSAAESYAKLHSIRFVDRTQDVEVVSITIEEALTLEPGERASLTVVLGPPDTTETEVQWSSADETVAVVDENGEVEGRYIGETVILATATNGAVAECKVTVTKKPVHAESIVLSAAELKIAIGDMRSVTATVLPVQSDNGAVTWIIDKPEVATWYKGCVTGVAEGIAMLTATTEGGLVASCTIRVVKSLETSTPMGTADFILPGALTEIENEAFVGGGMEIVSCPDGLKRIGVRAFAQCGKLRQIYIPPTVTSIADDAFEDCSAGLIIYCKAGSAAESFALEHDYEFGIVK